MNLNLIDNSGCIYYSGNFNEVMTEVKNYNKTKPSKTLLDMKKCTMNDKPTLEDLKTILSNRFGYNIELMAAYMGMPVDQVYSILLGETPISAELLEKLEKETTACQGDYIQIGDRIELNNSGDGTINYSRLPKKLPFLRRLYAEMDRLKKESREKDELIAALKEANELLKKDKGKE